MADLTYNSYPSLSFTNPLSDPKSLGAYSLPSLSDITGTNLNRVEAQTGIGSQSPTGTINVSPQLQGAIGQYTNFANQFNGYNPYLGRSNLSMNFAGPGAYQNGLQNGIDYFGRLGLSEGLQNIGLQEHNQNNNIAQMLGRIPGMNGVLGVLQNQNLFRSQLAGNPLYSQAQKDTQQRIMDQINLQNQLTQLLNQTQLQGLGFNQQAKLAELQSKLATGQPYQNLLEILSGLQGQNRGVTSTQTQIDAKNFK